MIDRSNWRAEILARMDESFRPWGLSIGDGWKTLVCDLIDRIEAFVGRGITIYQVKKKFAGLRFYVEESLPEIASKLIREAEAVSFAICEDCGGQGKLQHDTGAIVTLCDPCSDKWKRERDAKFPWLKDMRKGNR